jgi:molecular chaperone DnaK
MKNEAKANEATDKAEREKVDKLNMADGMVFQTEKQLKEYGDKIPQDKRTVIENAVEQLKEAHKKQDIAAVDSALASLNAAWTAASQDIYNAQAAAGAQAQQQQGQGTSEQATTEQGTGASGENVTDVPYEEVK